MNVPADLAQRARGLGEAAARLDPVTVVLVAAAAFASFLAVSLLLGLAWAKRLLRSVLGAALGALAGLFIYAMGGWLAADPRPPFPDGFLALSVEAARSGTEVEAFCVVLGALVGMVATRGSWRFAGLASYVALASVVSGYLIHVVFVALPSVPRSALPLSLALFVAEATSLLLVAIHSFYSLDVAMRKRWRRRPEEVAFSRYHQPKVAFHVAVYNEPPSMVLATLRSLLALEYPRDRLVVLVLDDSTDADARAPVERFCEEHGFVYHHRTHRRGFKAGALNEGLKMTPADVDLVAVLDADYQVQPEYLRETVGHFIDPRLGFLQTPQDYRNAGQSFLTQRYYHADAYFYRAVLPSRNEENAIIFCGTMGILRRNAIEEAGGWAETCLTEDAELSVRLLELGYRSLYVDRTYGRGLIPPTYDAYQKQHHRWAYGSVQVLRTHFRRLLMGKLAVRQKVDFLVGTLHWFDGAAVFLLAAILLAMGVADAAGSPLLTHHEWEVWLLGLVPLFLLFDGVLRLHLALRRTLRLPFRDTLGVLGMWMSVKLSNARGALKALFGIRMAFARTPKDAPLSTSARASLRRALRLTPVESVMALLLAATAVAVMAKMALGAMDVTRGLLALWLLYYAAVFGTAPFYAYKSFTTYRPGEESAAPSPPPVARAVEGESPGL